MGRVDSYMNELSISELSGSETDLPSTRWAVTKLNVLSTPQRAEAAQSVTPDLTIDNNSYAASLKLSLLSQAQGQDDALPRPLPSSNRLLGDSPNTTPRLYMLQWPRAGSPDPVEGRNPNHTHHAIEESQIRQGEVGSDFVYRRPLRIFLSRRSGQPPAPLLSAPSSRLSDPSLHPRSLRRTW